MSETSETNETRGRCRREITAAFEGTGFTANKEIWLLADALDRLAADVAEVNRSVCEELDGIAADVRAMNPSVRKELDRIAADVAAVKEATLPQTIEERDAAIRERDEARAEAERRRMQLAVCAVLADSNTTESLERTRQVHPDYDCAAVQSVIRAVEREITLRSEAERLYAELAARPTAAGWLTADDCWQLRVAVEHLKRLGSDACVKTIEGLLARAGSPPVVEVPEMVFGSGSYEMQKRYRAALDKAGIQWREVPCE